jgi:branched-chain amino acid transport system substrate-binding protein
MKKYIYIVVVLIVALIIVVTIYGNKKENVIKIGFVGPFTGNSAIFGEYMERGLALAKEKMGDDFSRVEIIREDDMCSAKNAISAVQKLITLDKVKYIIGPLCNESSLATENLFEDNKVISLTVGLPSNAIANMGEYHFSFAPEIEYLMKAVTSEFKDQSLKKVAVIHMISPFEEENYKHFVKYYKETGGEIVADEAVVKGTTDFKSIILKIKNARPDSLILIAHTGELNNILKQLGDQGLLYLPKFSIHAAQTGLLAQVSDLAESLIYPYPADKSGIPAAEEYANAYRVKFNTDPEPSSVNVYDSINILIKAVDKCGYDNTSCVQKYFASLKDYQGANGSLSVDNRGVGMYKEIMLKTVSKGKFVKYSK